MNNTLRGRQVTVYLRFGLRNDSRNHAVIAERFGGITFNASHRVDPLLERGLSCICRAT